MDGVNASGMGFWGRIFPPSLVRSLIEYSVPAVADLHRGAERE